MNVHLFIDAWRTLDSGVENGNAALEKTGCADAMPAHPKRLRPRFYGRDRPGRLAV